MRDSTADELGAVLRNLLALRGLGFDDVAGSIISTTVPQLGPEWTATAERYLGHEMLVVGPGLRVSGGSVGVGEHLQLDDDKVGG